ncbi:hypothetical protein LXL04_033747 [Taraxacum kok-saghyz]
MVKRLLLYFWGWTGMDTLFLRQGQNGTSQDGGTEVQSFDIIDLITKRAKMKMGLANGCLLGDSLVFYYAGRGSHMRDANGDERDGYDEPL